MLSHYLKTVLRILRKNKIYTVINIAGLATGIAVCLILFMVISYHAGFDGFHTKKDRIYRLLTEYHHTDAKDVFYGKGIPSSFPETIKNNFPQIEEVALIFGTTGNQFLLTGLPDGRILKFKEEKGVFYTTPAFFKTFTFPLLAGSAESLNGPNHVLLTKEIADKYFGDWKLAIGKTMKLNNVDLLTVTGVLATIPDNTDFRLKAVISYGTGFTGNIMKSKNYDGTNSDFSCFLLFPDKKNVPVFNAQLGAFTKKFRAPDDHDVLTMEPFSEVHYDPAAGDFSRTTVSRNLIAIMWVIAGFILLIACVNFVNLSTAQAVNRSKEVGIRKVLGGNKSQLIRQYLSETLLIVCTSIGLAVVITWICSPYVSRLLEIPLAMSGKNAGSIIFFLLAMAVVVTLLAGFYPALILSGYSPLKALKSKQVERNKSGISVRRGLVVFQFLIAQGLVIATVVIVQQMSYFSSMPIGFDKTAIVNIPVPGDSVNSQKLDFLKTKLRELGGVQSVSFNSNTPIEDNNDNWTNFNFNHSTKRTDFYSILKLADNDYVTCYQLPLAAGRNMKASDTVREFLVNEQLAKALGMKTPDEALNKEIAFSETTRGTIVGVLKDFHTRTFRDELAPMLITSYKRDYTEASVKLRSADALAVIQQLDKVWTGIFPDFVFEYKFLDEKINSFYKKENQLSQLYKIFAGLAILLSCLGLYGLATFLAAQRIREVGIRKVLGASTGNILYLFSKEFIGLITIAFAIAAPVTWYFMQHWLEHYPFRINLSPGLFLLTGMGSLAIALATVSFQALKAALANPVTSLRND